MKLLVCAIQDSKVNSFGGLMLFRSRGEASRQLADMAKDTSLPFHRHPADYSLWLLGSYDDNSGSVEACKPERVMGCDEV